MAVVVSFTNSRQKIWRQNDDFAVAQRDEKLGVARRHRQILHRTLHGNVEHRHEAEDAPDGHVAVRISANDEAFAGARQRGERERAVRQANLFAVDRVRLKRVVVLLVGGEHHVAPGRQPQVRDDDALDARLAGRLQGAHVLALLDRVDVDGAVERAAHGHVERRGQPDARHRPVVTVQNLNGLQMRRLRCGRHVPNDARRVARARHQLGAAFVQREASDDVDVLAGRAEQLEARQSVHLDAVVQLAADEE